MSRKTGKPPAPRVLDPTTEEALSQALRPIAPPVESAGDLRERVLARARHAVQESPAGLVTIRAGEGRWQRIAPGVTMKLLHADDEAKTRSFLLRLQPGASLPAHPHHADEECIVLEGEAYLGGTVVHAGDYHLAPRGVPHGRITSETGALLFLRAEVTGATSWIYRVLSDTLRRRTP